MYLNQQVLKARFDDEAIHELVRKHFPYEKFQGEQERAIFETVKALTTQGKRHVIIDAPTGIGKSAVAVTVHRVIEDMVFLTNTSPDPRFNWRTTIATTTKALQDQYIRDYPEITDLRGKTNYPCHKNAQNYGTRACKQALKDYRCGGKTECPYLIQRNEWCLRSSLRVLNTALAVEMCPLLCMTEDNYAPLMILDECHKVRQTVLDHTAMKFSRKELAYYAKAGLTNVTEILAQVEKILENFGNWFYEGGEVGKLWHPDHEFVEICKVINELCLETVELLQSILKKKSNDLSPVQEDNLYDCISYLQELENITQLSTRTDLNDFVVHEYQKTFQPDGSVGEFYIVLKPIIVKDVIDYAIFRKNDYFVHMSATVCGAGAYMEELGLTEEETHVITLENPIPKENRPIYYMPVGRMNARSQEQTMPALVDMLSDIMDNYPNKNGLVHVSSYALAEQIVQRMPVRHRQNMFVGRDKRQTIMELRRAANEGRQLVAVSPSMKEGVDLKHDLGRFQVIAKIPFGNLGDPHVKYVSDKMPVIYMRDTVLDVVQSCGRCVRGVDDSADTFILDGSFDTILAKGSELLPAWWVDTLVKC